MNPVLILMFDIFNTFGLNFSDLFQFIYIGCLIIFGNGILLVLVNYFYLFS